MAILNLRRCAGAMRDIILEELRRASIFKEESKFSLDYIPDHLIDREEQLRILAAYYKNLLFMN